MAQTIEMNVNNVKNESTNGAKVSQSFVTAWGTDPERYWERPDYVKVIADKAMEQIQLSLIEDYGRKEWIGVLQSWGCVMPDKSVVGKILRWREMPALALHVHGYEHEGWVIVSLNEGADTYEVELADEQFYAKEGSRVEDVYCDQLGSLIDTMVERGTCSEEEYKAKIAASYPELEWATKQQGRQVVYL